LTAGVPRVPVATPSQRAVRFSPAPSTHCHSHSRPLTHARSKVGRDGGREGGGERERSRAHARRERGRARTRLYQQTMSITGLYQETMSITGGPGRGPVPDVASPYHNDKHMFPARTHVSRGFLRAHVSRGFFPRGSPVCPLGQRNDTDHGDSQPRCTSAHLRVMNSPKVRGAESASPPPSPPALLDCEAGI
jgi:hypothetical protein